MKKKDIKRSRKKWQIISKRIVLAFIAIILIFALTLVGIYIYFNQKGKSTILPNLTENTEYSDTIEYNGHTYKYNDDIVAIAFLGIDQYDMQTNDQTDFVGANDADIVVAIDTETGDAKVIAIPRDTMVELDIYNGKNYVESEVNQLYLAYAYGDGAEVSCENCMTAISRVLYNVPIEKYYALNMQGISAINDAIGGVMVKSEIDMPEYNVKTGDVVTLKDKMAESYVRARSHEYAEGSLERTSRQVKYITSFAEQTVPAVFIDFSTINKLYTVGAEYSQSNITLADLTYLASLMISNDTTDFKTYQIEGTMNAVKDDAAENAYHAEFTPDEDQLIQTVLDVFYLKIS